MKLFLDTADLAAITQCIPMGLINGITTNPSNLSKQGGDPLSIVKQICELLPDGDVSVEITQKDPDAVYAQAKKIATLAPNVFVKIPCHPNYFTVIKRLVAEQVPLNITLLFSLSQSLFMCKLGVAYISPFVGRLDDAQADGIALLHDIRGMIDWHGFETRILAASIRTASKAELAIKAGVDAITVPVAVFTSMTMHTLTTQGMEQFDRDWQVLKVPLFP